MREKRGACFPCGIAPLPKEPVSQHRCMSLRKTDGNDKTNEDDANTLS